jgi:hypothetical protein
MRISNVKKLNSTHDMVALGNTNNFNYIFSRFIYANTSTFSNNMNASNSYLNLQITAMYIKNNNTLFALFFDSIERIILGEIDIAN